MQTSYPVVTRLGVLLIPCLAGSPMTAMAADVCLSGANIIDGPEATDDVCDLDAGASVRITEQGSLETTGGTDAVLVDGVSAGTILNEGTITTVNGAGILVDNAGAVAASIENSGQIQGGGASGIDVRDGAAVLGSIVNDGDISYGDDAVFLRATTVGGDLINRGTIASTVNNDGINLQTANLTGDLINEGRVEAADNALEIVVNSTIGGSIINSGVASGDDIGLALAFGGSVQSVENSGTIEGRDEVGLAVSGFTINDRIVNSGLIEGPVAVLSDPSAPYLLINQEAGIIRGSTAFSATGAAQATTIDNYGLLDGNVILELGTLNLLGDASRVSGVITGLGGSSVNVSGMFTTEGAVSVGTLAVAASGALSLDNDVTATSVTNAGTVAIADGAARSVIGDYSQAGSGRLQIEASSDSSYGQLVVTGTADFSASDALHVVVSPGSLAVGDELLDVVQATTLNASGATVTDNSALLAFEAVIDGNSIDLRSTARSIEGVVDAGGNAGGAGSALDAVIDEGAAGDMQPIVNALGGLPTDQSIENAVQKLLPAITGSHARGHVVAAQAGATSIVRDRMIRLAGRNATSIVQARGIRRSDRNPSLTGNRMLHLTGLNANSMTRDRNANSAPLVERAAWIKPFAADTAQGARGGVSGFDGQTIGAAIGIDGPFTEDFRAGVALSYADATIDGRGVSDSSVNVDTVQVTGYGTYVLDGKTHVNLLGAFGWNSNDSRRVIDFGGLDRTAKADYDSWHATAEVELVRSYRLSEDLGFMPSLAAEYTYARAEGYSESGAGAANLDVDAADADSLNLAVSGRLIYGLAEGIDLSGDLGVVYDVLAGDDQVTATFQGGGSFVTEGIDPAPFGVTGGAALELAPKSGIDASLSYDIDAREDFRNHKVQLNLRIPF